jgi:sulfur carrier protein ThiS
MPIKLTYRDKHFEVPEGITVRDAIKKVGLSPESILATRKGKLLADDEILKGDEPVKLIAVISGGGRV